LSSLERWPPLLRAILAQALAFFLMLAAASLVARPMPAGIPLLGQALVAVLLSRYLRLGAIWIGFQALLPFAVFWQLGHRVPSWVYPSLLIGLLLVFGGGVRSRVPLYHSSRAAWKALLELLPAEGEVSVADLGAGFGGPLVYLVRQRPGLRAVGVEASLLVWFVAWLRALPVRGRCRMRLGSFWDLDLGDFQVVYAFLSPVPMPALWEKARREMKPGALLISNTFAIPGTSAEQVIPLPGRRDACLWVYRLP